jgi:hypothetical protein
LLPKFHEMEREAGRDPGSMPVTVLGAAEDLDALKRDRDAGVSRVIMTLESAASDAILPQLDRWARLIPEL